MTGRRVLHGLFFYPRGGSAQVVRYVCRALPDEGWQPTIITGSAGLGDDTRNAGRFFAGLDVHAVDYTPALEAWARGEDPLDQPVPLHASYEDRPDVPDRVFAAVSPELADRAVAAWGAALAEVGMADVDVLHLHHLTPIHDAIAQQWPALPVVTHLHGTELLMLEEIDAAGRSPWPYADVWASRMRAAAARSRRVLAVSPDHAARAQRLLAVPDERLVVVPNGVDLTRFLPSEPTAAERLACWRRWLVEDPQGWDDSGLPGSIRYTDADLAAFADPVTGAPRPVLLYVGRFTAVKRLPLLLRAYARLRAESPAVAPLVIWGGHPGEWEGEHPHRVATALGVEGVFFLGWRGHEELPTGLACSDLLVVPSVGEAFGAVYVEAMAAGVPVVAAAAGGPLSIVNVDPSRPDGWLVRPDDEDALVDALRTALEVPEERRRRGEHAYLHAHGRFSWTSVAERVATVYDDVLSEAAAR